MVWKPRFGAECSPFQLRKSVKKSSRRKGNKAIAESRIFSWPDGIVIL